MPRTFPIVFLMALSLLTACAEPEEQTPDTPDSADSQPEDTTPDDTEAKTKAQPEADSDANTDKPVCLAQESPPDDPDDGQAPVKKNTKPKASREFEVICEQDQTRELVQTLQRALAARDLYDGPISGRITPDTRTAIRAYQQTIGLHSDELSRTAAEKLGLVVVPLKGAN